MMPRKSSLPVMTNFQAARELRAYIKSLEKKDATMHVSMSLNVSDYLADPRKFARKIPKGRTDEKRLTLEIIYPLSRPARFSMTSPTGFSVADLVEKICEAYAQIYDEEAATSTVEEGRAGALLNRNETDGDYGIWGHELGDLFIEGIEVADGICKPRMGS